MVEFPTEIPETWPVAFTVATERLLEVQLAAVPDPFNWTVDPTQTALGPVITGKATTLTVTELLQPSEFVYVICAVPIDSADTRPVAEIVATPVLFDTQALLLAAVAVPVNCDCAFTQM